VSKIEMIRSLNLVLIPNKEQEKYLKNACGTARWAYNFALGCKNDYYDRYNQNLKGGYIRKRITEMKNEMEEYSWLKDISNNVTKQAVKDCDRAFLNFFRGKARHPKFKKKGRSKESFYVEKIKFIRVGNQLYVKIEKLKQPILLSKEATKYKNIENVEGIFNNPRIKFNGRRWEISFSIKFREPIKELTEEVIGIDLGITNTAICSNGRIYKNINKTSNKLKRLEKRKKKTQRRISKKYEMNKQGGKFNKTNNIIKEEKKLSRINHTISNIRKDYNHKISKDIVNELPRAIVMENLNVRGMMKNKHLARAIQEQNFYTLLTFIKYKAESQGTKFIQVPRNFKSTQLCSKCGDEYKIRLSERTYQCSSCGLEIDRDLNSALNLRNYGLNHLNSQTA